MPRFIAAYYGDLDEPPTVTLRRDAEISRLAQHGAGLALTNFAESQRSEWPPFDLGLFDEDFGYRDTAVCGPAPLTVDAMREVLTDDSYEDQVGNTVIQDLDAIVRFGDALVGVGYVDRDGLACSYTLLRSANYPFD